MKPVGVMDAEGVALVQDEEMVTSNFLLHEPETEKLHKFYLSRVNAYSIFLGSTNKHKLAYVCWSSEKQTS